MTASKWLKSKRSRSGATSEPACFTCVPSTSRSAQCRTCVAVWLRRMRSRRVAVDRARRPRRPRASVPASTIAAVQRRGPAARTACRRPRTRAAPSARRRSCRCRRPGRRTRRRTGCGRGRRRPWCPRPACASRSPPADERAHLRAAGLVLLAPGELGGPVARRAARGTARPARARLAARGLVRLLGPRALLAPCAPSNAVEVDRAAALLRDLAREVDREAERVVEEERVVAADVALARRCRRACRRRVRASGGTAPPRAARRCATSSWLLHELGVRAAHDVDGRVDERGRDEVSTPSRYA